MAIVHGLPLASGVPGTAQLIVPEGSWTGLRNGVNYRLGHLTDKDVDRRRVAVTTTSRTWLDVARTHDLADSLSAGDGALRAGTVDAEALQVSLAGLGRLRGIRRAARALPLLDGARETALESWSYALFVQWGLPLPLMQHELRDRQGLIGRVDFYWPQMRLVGEADGRLKYDSPRALYAEKRREDRLRARGHGVIRWGWEDLVHHPEALRARLVTVLLR